MSEVKQWLSNRMAALNISQYDYEGEAVLREQLAQELRDMAWEHDKFMDLSGSLHNADFEDADWEVVE